ncbi:MAG: (2Fe-2S)-binding protein [Bacillota bacterium]
MDDKDIIVCRCEDISLAEIRQLIAKGHHTMDEIKRLSRCGMGPCQGRTCRSIVAQELARAIGKGIEEVVPSTYRPPIKPVKLDAFLRGEGDA